MKVGDLVKHRDDGDTGIILKIVQDPDDQSLTFEMLWTRDGYTPLNCYGHPYGDNLEVISESR